MQIYLTDLKDKKLKSEHLKLLSPRAKNAFLRLCARNEKHALQTAAADLLLKKAISPLILPATKTQTASEVFAFNVIETDGGKPYIDGAPDFSISHSENLAAVAVADDNEGELGLDVQLLTDSVSPALLKGVFSEYEADVFKKIETEPDKIKYFYKTFTEKESYVKFTGEGFKTLPREINNFNGAKFLTKYVFNRNELYCLTVCAENISSLKINVCLFDDLLF